MPICLVGLGSNLGDRAKAITEAVQQLRRHERIEIAAVSRYQETAPIGGPGGQGPFLNAVARLETTLPPQPLLAKLTEIEGQLGRQRGRRWDARVIDLDLLLYGDLICESPQLRIPHPAMAYRRFVLEGAAQVAADLVHPEIGWTVGRLLDHLNTAKAYVAITGAAPAANTAVVQVLAQNAAVRPLIDPANISSAGQAATASIECLHRRAELLAADSWPDDSQTAVSDFWFDESLATAEGDLTAGQFQALKEVYERLRNRVVRPKLLVLLDASACRKEPTDPPIRPLSDQLSQLAAQPGQGPVLRLDAGDRDTSVIEVAAAIEAMK